MSYGNDGYGGGGGYQTTSYAGGGNGFFTGSQGGGSQGSPSKDVRKNTLRPVTIKQILEATQPSPEGSYHIDDQEVALVTFVAQIRNVVEQNINNTYRMDDGTGQLEVKQWIDSDKPAPTTADADTQSQLVENAYVRVLGSLKVFQGKKTIASHMIRPVTDFNEVQYHMLEATAVHLLFTRGPPPEGGSGGGQGQQHGAGGYGMKEEYGGDTGMGGMAGAGAGAAGGGGGGNNLPSNTTPNARKVWNTIRTRGESNEGLHVNAIAQASGLQMQAVYSAVEELLGFGVVYTTLDDEHIACMDF